MQESGLNKFSQSFSKRKPGGIPMNKKALVIVVSLVSLVILGIIRLADFGNSIPSPAVPARTVTVPDGSKPSQIIAIGTKNSQIQYTVTRTVTDKGTFIDAHVNENVPIRTNDIVVAVRNDLIGKKLIASDAKEVSRNETNNLPEDLIVDPKNPVEMSSQSSPCLFLRYPAAS
jgi:hypothetical protein